METNLTQYVYNKMLSDAKNYQWRIVFDSHKKALEVYFVVSLTIKENQYVQDINGQVNRKEKLQLEDVICIYDENNHLISPDNYLYALPFDVDQGIEEGEVDALLKQLNIITSGATTKLRHFLVDEKQTEFTLEWNDANFRSTIETLKNTNHYSTKRRTFQLQDDKSLVDQFKENQYDGMERI